MNTPGYYNLNGGDIISAAFNTSFEEGKAFCKWMAMKYIVRLQNKQDIEKAIDVLIRLLEQEEKREVVADRITNQNVSQVTNKQSYK